MTSSSIPPGFVQCEVCGLYNGRTQWENLNWPEGLDSEDESEATVSVTCLCHGIVCGTCKQNKILRPGSNVYYPETNSVEHVPCFAGMMPCQECRAKEKSSQSRFREKRSLKRTERKALPAEPT